MTTIEIDSSPHDIKISTKISTGTKIISIGKSPFLYLVFERRGRGSRGLSKYHRIKQIFVDKQNRAFAEIVMPDADGSGQSYKYAPVGRLLSPEEEGAIST